MADENVANFVAMTGADEGMAASYLDMCGGHLESAVGLFLDMAGASNMDAAEDTATATAAAVPTMTMSTSTNNTPTAHSILLGAHDTPIPTAWKEQDLQFCESSWGMSQNKNGPCGVLAVLNALALVHAGLPEPTSVASASSSTEQSLLWAIATILQTIARESSTDTVKIASFSSPGSTEITHTDILLKDEETKSGVADRLMEALKSFSLGPGACLLVCYSAILTRGVEQVLEDAKVDGGLPPLIHGPFSICTTELMNLLLFGVARGNVSAYGGMTRTGQKDTWRKSSHVGLLSIDEVESGISLADELKNPSHPIWILHGGDHFTILWAANTSTKNDEENSLELHHWNGLPPNRRMARLRLEPATLEVLPPAPSTYTPSTYRMELNTVESIVQADSNDKITWPGAWKMYRYELSLVTRQHVEDDMQTPPRPDSVSEPPKYNIIDLNINSNDVVVINNGKWRCASCYRTRFETWCFGENDAAVDVCKFCNLSRSEAGTTIWVPFKDLDPRTQRSRMMIPKLLTVLRTRWSQANLSLFSSETQSFIPLGETTLSSSFELPAI
eukprot:scaffold10619_cov41-Attheya_sp.AAC.2